MPSSGTSRSAFDIEVLEIVEDSEPEREEQRRSWRRGNHATKDKRISEDSSDSDTPFPKFNQATTVRTSVDTPLSIIKPSGKSSGNITTNNCPERSGSLNLQHFAFQQTGTSTLKVASPALSAKPGIRNSTQPLANMQTDISTNDVDLLSFCVSCDVKWTARKTSVVKLAHILGCAKSRGLEVSTVKILIQKEIQSKSSSFKLSLPAQSTSKTSETLFENIAPSVPTKKRSVQRELHTALSTPRSSRDAILHKAQAILYNHGLPQPALSLSVPGDGPRRDNEADAISDSLRFGQSLLGQRLSSSKPGIVSKSCDTAPPPATINVQPNTRPSDTDLINHFSVLNVGTGLSNAAGVASKSLEPRCETIEGRLVTPTPKRNRQLPAFDEKWVSYMKERIQMDQTLHLRILRYEPVHFNVFLKVAESYAPLTSRLRLEVRHFLDSQAIHFFGAENIWGRKQ